jgi:DNA-directed RNA polymerase subunit RPC12/RpoP
MLENIFPTKEQQRKIANRYRKGLRVVTCPNCGRRIVAKWVEEVIADAKCGYVKKPAQKLSEVIHQEK